MKTSHSKSWYIKKWSLDIFVDILGGIFIALGTYNFAAAAEFPMVGVNGIALIFIICGDFLLDAPPCF